MEQKNNLDRIAEQLEQLTKEVRALNETLQTCIDEPAGEKPRLMVEAADYLQVITY